MDRRAIDTIAQHLVERRHGVALTGAGISVDSGIPDFRSTGGLWDRFDPMEYATIDGFLADPVKVWRMLVELDELVQTAEPNPGHLALAELERAGVRDGIVTQNVDNLHQRAGAEQVVEFHGNGSRLRCLDCGAVVDADEARKQGTPPRCECGAIYKPDVVLFGEAIPRRALDRAWSLARGCRVMMVVGTSAMVSPASTIPRMAKGRGAVFAELDLEPSALSWQCDLTCHGPASEVLPELARRVADLL